MTADCRRKSEDMLNDLCRKTTRRADAHSDTEAAEFLSS
eukprot:CAMPEP_0117598078 /NCGR_PEP_ID=MMETSP0784-20121206/75208_1 /TAXON_ID=39447 /ORGANISM="" /LENGTH=38 /DNA_ID= /DNA_START= /DNA_END= /DNA_ORIENTATION=